ncbi:MAG: hypothetical protein U0U46_16225 [Saprospiraceae bacterium]
MALGDFFRINMPYGMRKNDKNEWFVFNREYKPLGWNTYEYTEEENYPVHVRYKGLTEAKILKLTWSDKDGIRRNEKGEIDIFWLISDATNPKDSPKYWGDYFEKIKILSDLKAEGQ